MLLCPMLCIHDKGVYWLNVYKASRRAACHGGKVRSIPVPSFLGCIGSIPSVVRSMLISRLICLVPRLIITDNN